MASSLDHRPLDAILDAAVADRVFPGGVIAVGDAGELLYRRAFGLRARVPSLGPEVTLDTVYDCASLTKPVATTSVVVRLIEAGRLAFDTPAAAFLPELARPGDGKERITVRHLLAHAAGLIWWRPFYERLLAGERLDAPSAREAILRMAAAEPLEAPPGARCVYSDLSYILLGFLAERAGGDRLDRLAERTVFGPLGMKATRFVDLDGTPPVPRPSPVAPTELCPRRGLLAGEVHDDNCHAAGGVLGHAGLFSTATDLSTFAAALVLSWRGERVKDGFHRDVVRELLSPSGVPGSTRRLGWDGPSPEPGASQAGDLWPRTGAGHMGFTGTSLWLDLPRARWVVLLTNRVHPSRDDERIRQVRPRVHDAVVRMLP